MFESLISAGSSLLGGLFGANAAEDNAKRQAALQREFAQNGIQWKVEDAKKAGIHPLYALGANTATYSPVSVGDGGLPDAISKAGQFLGRAADATANQAERATARTLATLSVEKAGLENDLLRSQISRMNQGQTGPAMPALTDRHLIPGQPPTQVVDNSVVRDSPLKRTQPDPIAPNREGASVADVGFARTNTGWAPVPSSDVKERIEDNLIQEVMWAFRNNVLPSMGMNSSPPTVPAPPGQMWVYNPVKQEYQHWPKKAWYRNVLGY